MNLNLFIKRLVSFLFFVCIYVYVFAEDAPFITTWAITYDNEQISIPAYGSNITIDWGDGSDDTFTSLTGHAFHTYTSSGSYSVSISGGISYIRFPNNYQNKIESVDQWGDIEWTTMEEAFKNCSNLNILATDAPNLSKVTTLESMFEGAYTFNEDISHWNMSNIANTSWMFYDARSFNQSLGNWNVSKVTNMNGMFRETSEFNQPLDAWNVSRVETMASMFYQSNYNQPLNSWDVSSVTSMVAMFTKSKYNQPLNNWNVSNVTLMSSMFNDAGSFNQPLDQWDVSAVTNMQFMFDGAKSFNQDINGWDVSSVANMYGMFKSTTSFNQPLNDWDVSNVTTMYQMFSVTTAFDQPLDQWDVSSVTTMKDMFRGASAFNEPINDWNVSKVTDMSYMFYLATSFNQPINNWDVSNVTKMMAMFSYSPFNQMLGKWNVSKVTNMGSPIGYANRGMFAETPFNQDISNWDVSSVQYMNGMFYGATSFNQDISEWDISSVIDFNDFMTEASGFDRSNYDALLEGWGQLNLKSNKVFDAPLAYYCNSSSARQSIVENYSWTIIDGGEDCTVVRTSPNLSLDQLGQLVYGDKPFELTASSENKSDLVFESLNSDVIKIVGSKATILQSGECEIKVSQAETEEYFAASATKSVTIKKASLTIKAPDLIIQQNEDIPNYEMTFDGFVNGDSEEDIVLPSISASVLNSNTFGVFEILLSGGQAENYEINLVDGELTIEFVLTAKQTQLQKPSIYPNPTNDAFTISGPFETNKIAIVNSTGQLIKNTTDRQIEISDFQNGVYHIMIDTNNETYYLRLVKK